jgi:hypothetical protein
MLTEHHMGSCPLSETQHDERALGNARTEPVPPKTVRHTTPDYGWAYRELRRNEPQHR